MSKPTTNVVTFSFVHVDLLGKRYEGDFTAKVVLSDAEESRAGAIRRAILGGYVAEDGGLNTMDVYAATARAELQVRLQGDVPALWREAQGADLPREVLLALYEELRAALAVRQAELEAAVRAAREQIRADRERRRQEQAREVQAAEGKK